MTSKSFKRKAKYGSGNGFEEFGGYMASKISKLQNQYDNINLNLQNGTKTTNIFQGISVYVNGYTNPSSDVIKQLMKENGGTYQHYYSRKLVTHIIASNLPTSKVSKLTDQKYIKPSWITESINAGKLLPFFKYQLIPIDRKITNQKTIENNLNIISPEKKENFVSDYYNHSRLHHISQWSAELKSYVNSLQSIDSPTFLQKEILRKKCENQEIKISVKKIVPEKIIMHIDMDCFFVSVGLLERPDLQGKPVVVTHSDGNIVNNKPNESEFNLERKLWMNKNLDVKNNEQHVYETSDDNEDDKMYINTSIKANFISMSEIACCSYEARKFGIRNGMLLYKAKTLCPDLEFMAYNFDAYANVSKSLYEIIAGFTHEIEAVSCDELLINCTDIINDTGIDVLKFAEYLKQLIKDHTGCTASIGISENILLARLATRKAKPNGIFFLPFKDAEEFLKNDSIRNLPGIGCRLEKKLISLGIKTFSDVKRFSFDKLKTEIGSKVALNIMQFSRGIDNRTLKSSNVRKSVSVDVNYGIRYDKIENVDIFLSDLSNELSKRLKSISAKASLFTLKLRIRAEGAPIETAKYLGCGVCDSVSKTISVSEAINESSIISAECQKALRFLKPIISDLRGIAIHATKLEFLTNDRDRTKQNKFETITKFTIKKDCKCEISPLKLSKDEPESEIFSHLTDKNKEGYKKQAIESKSINENIFFSQINKDTFDELPLFIQKELKDDFCRLHVKKANDRPKKNRTSPQKKKKSIKISNNLELFAEKIEAKNMQMGNNEFSRSTICEAMNEIEVKHLIEEWLYSTNEPLDDDFQRFSKYLECLIENKDLELLSSILLFLKRKTKRMLLPWQNLFEKIFKVSQDRMKYKYSSVFKI